MAFDQKLEIEQELKQELVMTPALQQSIELLQKNRFELVNELKSELEENPLLDSPDMMGANNESQEEDTPEDEREEEDLLDEMDIDKYFDDEVTSNYTNFNKSRKAPSIEQTHGTSRTLRDHLLWQLKMDVKSSRMREIGESIIGNLDEDGYLRVPLEEIMNMGDYEREEVEEALERIQALDPLGVGARDIKECLLVQLKHNVDDPVAVKIVKNYLSLMEGGKYETIAGKLDESLETVKNSVDIIKSLTPKPGTEYSTDRTSYVTPEVFVYRVDDDFKVVMNNQDIPTLRISPTYKKLLEEEEVEDDEDDTKQYLKDKLRKALFFIQSINQRQQTIYKVSQSIVERQKDFLKEGIMHLKPMVLDDVAEDIEMHQSTVSRVVNDKYIHTPQGVYEMKFFFPSGLKGQNGEDISSLQAKALLKEFIEREDHEKPLSDSKLAEKLEKKGIEIARRTVAKYRKELSIPSSTERKKRYL